MPSLQATKNYLNRNFLSNGAIVPAFGSSGYLPGHVFVNNVTGVRYVNIGTVTSSMHVATGVNRVRLTENWLKLPRLQVDRGGGDIQASMEWVAASVDKRFFTAPFACVVMKISATVTVAGTGGAATAVINKIASGTAITAGTIIHTGSINLVGTADTVQAITVHGTIGNRTLAAGDSLGIDFTGTLTSATGNVTVLLRPLVSNEDFEVSGTNATSTSAAFADGGGITLTTAGGNNDQVLVGPAALLTSTPEVNSTSWAVDKWNTSDRPIFEMMVTTGANIASIRIFAGLKLTNTPVVATDDDQAYFLFDTGDATSATSWLAVSSRAGTDTETSCAVAVAVSTNYLLQIFVDSSRIPRFYINGALVVTGAALTADIDLKPFFGVMALTAAAKVGTFRPLSCEKALGND